MVKTAIDPPAELQRAASLLFKNWMLAIPTAAASLIIGIIQVFLLTGIFATALLGGAVAGRPGAVIAAILAALPLLCVFFVVAILLTLIAQAVVVHASEDVWEDRAVDLGRSFSVALGRLAALIGAFLLVLLIMIIPIALCFVAIGIPLVLIAFYFLMYVVPAIVLGNEIAHRSDRRILPDREGERRSEPLRTPRHHRRAHHRRNRRRHLRPSAGFCPAARGARRRRLHLGLRRARRGALLHAAPPANRR